ncbi:MAG: pilus assembly protein PilP [Bdellovibrionales bacterium]
MKLKDGLLSIFVYFSVAVGGVGLAAFLASGFFGKTLNAQQPNVAAPTQVNQNTQDALPGAQNTKPVTNDQAKDSDIVVEGTQGIGIRLQDVIEQYDYNPDSKSDPFQPYQAPVTVSKNGAVEGPVLPLQKFELDQLKVVGVIWGVNDPIAMVRDPNAKLHYIRERDKIGRNNGYVAQIRDSELIIVETFVYKGEISTQTQVMEIDHSAKR